MANYEHGEFGEFGAAEAPGEFAEFGEFGEFGEAEGLGEFGEAEGLGEFGELGEAEAESGHAESHEAEAHEAALTGILGAASRQSESPLSEAEQMELASELLEISNEQELEQFLGRVIRRAARRVGSFVKSPVGRALTGVLKNVAKRALPIVGGALGSMVAPGIGTAIGSKLGSMASGMFEVELETMPQEQAEYEVARRVVNLAAISARNASLARPRARVAPSTVALASLASAARRLAPGVYRRVARTVTAASRAWLGPQYRRRYPQPPSAGSWPSTPYAPTPAPAAVNPPDAGASVVTGSGRWVRRGRRIVLFGV